MIGRLARQLRRLGPVPVRTAQMPPQASGSRAPQPRTGLQPEADLRAGAAGAVVGAAGAGWPAAAASPERGFDPTGPGLNRNRSPMARGTDANPGSTAPAPACRSAAVAADMLPGSASADGTAVRPEASIVGSKPLSTSREAHAGRAAPAPAGSAATGAGWCRDPVAGGALVVAAAPSGEADRHQAGDARGTGGGPLLLTPGAGDRAARAASGGAASPPRPGPGGCAGIRYAPAPNGNWMAGCGSWYRGRRIRCRVRSLCWRAGSASGGASGDVPGCRPPVGCGSAPPCPGLPLRRWRRPRHWRWRWGSPCSWRSWG